MIIITPDARQVNVPGDDLVFGVEFDAGSERKYFQCPRYVGDKLDLASCFVRINYRNANGEMDSYLVDDVTVDGDNVTFSWVLSEKAVKYRGQIKFVVCAVGPNQKVEWHTTLGTGMVLEGLEPDTGIVESETADVVAALIAMVEMQTEIVKTEGAAQAQAVKTAAQAAEAAAVAEIEAKGVNTLASIPADYTATVNALRGCAGAIVCEAEGSAITVNDASDKHIQGMRIFGRSTQDGTPTPEAPVEIVSVENPVVTVCGKNLIPFPYTEMSKTKNGVTFTVNNDGSIHIKGTAEKATNLAIFSGSLPLSGAFTLSGVTNDRTPSTHYMQPYVDDVFQASLTNGGQTYEINGNLTAITLYVKSGETLDCVVRPQFEIGSAATEYEAPAMQQTSELTHTLPGIPVASGGNYTDSDGQQWICDEVDLERGVYVQRVAVEVCDGSADEKWWAYNGTNHEGYAKDADSMKSGAMQNGFCSRFPVHSAKNVEPGVWMGQGNNFIYLHNTKGIAADISVWLAWLSANPMTLAYPLAAPVETPLSEAELAAYRALHSNYPHTTVLNDSGAHMAVKYVADTKLYIDNKIAALAAR